MIDLVIITSGDMRRLTACLSTAAAALSELDDARLVIVVDTKGDAPYRLAQNLTDAKRTTVERGPRNGRSAARNFGASLAFGERIAFLDGDMLVAKDWLVQHAAAAQDGGILRGRIRELIGAAVTSCFEIGSPTFPAIKISDLAQYGFTPDGYRLITSVLERSVEEGFSNNDVELPKWLASCGANFSIARKDWDRLGGQSETFGRQWGCEDLEFSFRAIRRGLHIRYLPEACGYHLSHPQPDRWLQHQQSLRRFAEMAGDPAVTALEALLLPDGSLASYISRLTSTTD